MRYDFANEEARTFPPMVQLSITNVCDMSCGHCPHPLYKKEPGYRPSFMSMELFKKIADETGTHPESSLRLFGWGEPLVHPNLVDMVDYAKQCGVNIVNLITNGLKLDEKKSAQLLHAGLDLLEVSIDAITAETYENVRGNARTFPIIVRNVENYIAIRDQQNGHTYVSVSIIDQPRAHHEVDAFKQQWTGKADTVIVRTFHDFMGCAHDADQIILPERTPCRAQWSRFNVNAEGLVSLCFNDWHNTSIIGDMNAKDTTIQQVWSSPAYAASRQSHLDGKPLGVCANCNDWIAASWKQPYETLVQLALGKQQDRVGKKENAR
jgi:hypothetical protein